MKDDGYAAAVMTSLELRSSINSAAMRLKANNASSRVAGPAMLLSCLTTTATLVALV